MPYSPVRLPPIHAWYRRGEGRIFAALLLCSVLSLHPVPVWSVSSTAAGNDPVADPVPAITPATPVDPAGPSPARPAQLPSDPLQELITLAANGAPGLALRLMDNYQPDPEDGAWPRWERARIELMQQQKQWPAIIRRVEKYRTARQGGFADWAQTQRIEAMLASGQGRQAQRALASQLWLTGRLAGPEQIAVWREQLVRSYLLQGNAHDANTAMLRYELDYGSAGPEWALLRARVLLTDQRADVAAEVLAGNDSFAARVLSLLAALRADQRSAEVVLRQAAALQAEAAKSTTKPDKGAENTLAVSRADQALLWGVVNEAAQRASRHERRIAALEHLLLLDTSTPTWTGIFATDLEDQLWQAWQDNAERIANDRQLLIGDFDHWMSAAGKLSGKPDGTTAARSLWAYVALHSRSADTVTAAHIALMNSLTGRTAGGRGKHRTGKPAAGKVVGETEFRRLYLQGTQFVDIDMIPPIVRQSLVDLAIADSDLALASRLMGSMQQAPEGVGARVWQLRRARIFVLGGDHRRGIEAMQSLIASSDVISDSDANRYNQVLFDLQAIGENTAAFDLFEQLYSRVQGDDTRREILFWMADALKEAGYYARAARYYLRSATYGAQDAMDPWAQTARYQAAVVLARADLPDDARQLYERLLEVTRDPARRVVLRRAMQQLLLESNNGGQQGHDG